MTPAPGPGLPEVTSGPAGWCGGDITPSPGLCHFGLGWRAPRGPRHQVTPTCWRWQRVGRSWASCGPRPAIGQAGSAVTTAGATLLPRWWASCGPRPALGQAGSAVKTEGASAAQRCVIALGRRWWRPSSRSAAVGRGSRCPTMSAWPWSSSAGRSATSSCCRCSVAACCCSTRCGSLGRSSCATLRRLCARLSPR